MEGELEWDELHQTLFATDASVYKIQPLAVAFPKSDKDLLLLTDFARSERTSLIPRAAGTSLAGQCVGEGIVVDISKYFTRILDFDAKEQTKSELKDFLESLNSEQFSKIKKYFPFKVEKIIFLQSLKKLNLKKVKVLKKAAQHHIMVKNHSVL